jgi:isopentenyl-diphosphate delta-isomerase
MEEILILVDKHDNAVGTERKMPIHQQGLLHRAFSIFIFDSEGKLLLQQRATGKYHSAELWTNSCCGHPRQGEETLNAAQRRLQEEMGFSCPLIRVSSLIYHAEVPGDLIENEYDHIYLGLFNDEPQVNPSEAKDWKWIGLRQLYQEIAQHTDIYTVLFQKILNDIPLVKFEQWQRDHLHKDN